MYKILTGITENYYGVQTSHFKTVNYSDMCNIKNIKPKLGVKKWAYSLLQSNRISTAYPNSLLVANWFGLRDMPVDDCDQPSDWDVTMKYIVSMYGEYYARSFERADYPELRKAA